MKRLLSILLPLSIAFIFGCDSSKPRLDVPIEGVWSVGDGLDLNTYYIITFDNDNNDGTITVESGGKEVCKHEFNVTNSNTVTIVGSDRGPHEDQGSFSRNMIVDIFQLKDPPSELRFSDTPSPGQDPPPDLPDLPAGVEFIFFAGLIESMPLGIPMKRVTDDERMPLPFENVSADLDIHLSGVTGRMTSDGPWGESPLSFDEPVHPLGDVRSIKIDGRNVSLKSTKINEGLLSTENFGDIEIVMYGTGNQIEARATRPQIEKMKKWLSSK